MSNEKQTTQSVLQDVAKDVDVLYESVPPGNPVASGAWRRIVKRMHAAGVPGYTMAAVQMDAEEREAREKAEAEAFGARFHRGLLQAIKSGEHHGLTLLACAMEAAGIAGVKQVVDDDERPPQFATREEAEQAMRDLSGVNSVVRGEPKVVTTEERSEWSGRHRRVTRLDQSAHANCAHGNIMGIGSTSAAPEKSEPAPPAKFPSTLDQMQSVGCAGCGVVGGHSLTCGVYAAERRGAARAEKHVRSELADRLATILPPGQRPATWGLDDALEEVERRLNDKPGPVASAIRDAALDEAAVTALGMAEWGWPAREAIAAAIRTLKSKPTPQPSENPGELRAGFEALQREGMKRAAEKWERGEMDGPTPATDDRKTCAKCGGHGQHIGVCVEPVHDFGWALQQMRAGKKVRRKASITPAGMDSQAIDMGWVQLGRGRLSWESMSAADWEVVG